jgi:endonuclease/exonuclease/phosphatase family metal-dependent hydrolase
MPKRSWFALSIAALITVTTLTPGVIAAGDDIVLHSADVTAVKGNWSKVADSSAATGTMMSSADVGWSKTDAPLASPADYFEANFNADPNTPYHVWLRLRASGDSKWNDSVFVQFADDAAQHDFSPVIDQNGAAVYAIGTASALTANLESCGGCGTRGWGWVDSGWWLNASPVVTFRTGGTHTIRVQTREDGVQIDQIVLSPSTYLWNAPGSVTSDNTIISTTTAAVAGSAGGGGATSSPYNNGSPASIPGTVALQNFDNGGQDVAYHDSSSGNSGGAFRPTDVDLEASTDGGFDVGWITPGEWLNYGVNVTSGGTYTVTFRVASPGVGGTFHLEMNGANVTGAMSVPSTGGWQTWTSVSKSVSLSAGVQIAKVVFDSVGSGGGVGNVASMTFTAGGGSGSGGSTASTSTPYTGSPIAVPGVIEAEYFDNGGQDVSYRDGDPRNTGGELRSTGVDLESASTGGYDVGWTSPGEWLNYTVNVSASGTYTVAFRVACAGAGGTFHLEANGTNVTGSLSVPNTGGWQNWQSVSKTVTLSAGQQILRLVMDSYGSSGALGNFDSFQFVSGASAPAPPPPPPSSSSKLRVMTWNIQMGEDLNKVYNPYAQALFMAQQNADVIILQEVSTWVDWQPTLFPQLLQQATGQFWYSVWVPGSGCYVQAGCAGDLIMSRLPINDSQTTLVAQPSGLGRAAINVGGVPISIFTIHLEYYDTNLRTQELLATMNWARQFGGPRLVGGDFNSWWDEWWIHMMETEYSDTWVDVNHTQGGGESTGNIRFDYWFRSFDSSWRLTPTNIFTPWTTLSDHRPMVADFNVQ